MRVLVLAAVWAAHFGAGQRKSGKQLELLAAQFNPKSRPEPDNECVPLAAPTRPTRSRWRALARLASKLGLPPPAGPSSSSGAQINLATTQSQRNKQTSAQTGRSPTQLKRTHLYIGNICYRGRHKSNRLISVLGPSSGRSRAHLRGRFLRSRGAGQLVQCGQIIPPSCVGRAPSPCSLTGPKPGRRGPNCRRTNLATFATRSTARRGTGQRKMAAHLGRRPRPAL